MPEEINNHHDLSQDLKDCLKILVDKYEKEDSFIRKQQIRMWKKNEEFWHGMQHIFWSETRQDWVSPIEMKMFDQEEGRTGVDGPFYDYVINIFRPHGEAVIAALGAQVPTVRFPPDDAEDEEDIQTSRTYNKISDLIDRHNQVKSLQLMTLFQMWNQGDVFWYHASKADKAFGMTHIENFKKQLTCKACGKTEPMDDQEVEGMKKCSECGGELEAQTVLDGFDEAPKTRVVIDSFGGLHVKVPFWARAQGDCGYLIWSLDQPKPFLQEIYDHISEKIETDAFDAQSSEKQGRTPSSFSNTSRADDNLDNATHRRIWMRPWVINGLPSTKAEEKKKLRKMFPNGIYVSYVGNVYAESRDEDLDKHWTIVKCGMSTYIHSDPIGQPLISPQELRNTLVNITVETIEQGMSSGFADPEVLNFNTYAAHEARPGMIYPAKPKPGQNLGVSFYESGRATLSKEVGQFAQQLDKDAQFVVGSFPSLYGGPGEGKSRTLGEYQQSRQQALQRLSIVWSLFCIGWTKLKQKCVHLYVENMIEDERFTVPDPHKKGDYANVWIRKAELTGHVGEVEPESGDNFPVSMGAKQALFFKLLEMNNEFINAALFDPENRRDIADLTGFTDLEIPGESQRMKQVGEINAIIKGEQVTVDPLVDEHPIHISTCKSFLVGQIGLDLKKTNPIAYQAITQHLQTHGQLQQMQTQAPFQGTPPGQPPPQGNQ